MEFRKMSIGLFKYGNYIYQPEKLVRFDDDLNEDETLLKECLAEEKEEPTANFKFSDPLFEAHLADKNHENHQNILNYLVHIALCHTILILEGEEKKSKGTYSA